MPFIAELMRPECEVLLHGMFHPEESVIAINNGRLSGRNIGSPLTDFTKQMIQDNQYSERQYLTNCSRSSKGKRFMSSIYFIKNEEQIIRMLCINRDMSLIKDVFRILKAVKERFNLSPMDEEVMGVLSNMPMDQMLERMIENTVNQYGRGPKRLTENEKMAIVDQLRAQGAFYMRGAVRGTVGQLNVSESTVYRYLNKNS